MCSSTPEPDPLIGQSAMANADIAREALAYYKQRDQEQKPRQARMDEITQKLADQQLSTSQFNDQQARDTWRRYQDKGIPAEDAMYADAANYDTKASRDQAAGEAVDDVAAAQARAREAQSRSMARSGINPADGRALAMEQEAGAQDALGQAAAANGARKNVRDMGIMLHKDAASFARGMPGSAAQTFGVASAAGGQASGAVGSAISAANSTAGMMGNGFGIGINGNASAGGIMNSKYATDVNRYSAQNQAMHDMMNDVGGIGEAVFMSDENIKENVEPVDDDAALEGIEKTDIKSWRYKKGSAGDDGGRTHVGGMAQDLKKNLGETVAPGGKMVDIISAIGATMAATKALSKKVDRIAARGIK